MRWGERGRFSVSGMCPAIASLALPRPQEGRKFGLAGAGRPAILPSPMLGGVEQFSWGRDRPGPL